MKGSDMAGVLGSRKIKVLVGFAVSALLLAWLFRKIEWAQVAKHLAAAELWPILPLLAVFFVHYLLRALRWRLLLPEGRSLPLRLSMDASMIGNYATFLLPLRAGEFVRPWFLASRSSYSFSQAFVSIVIERFFDLATVLLMFALVIGNHAGLPDWVGLGARSLSGLAIALLLFMLVASLLPDFVLKTAESLMALGYYVGVKEKTQQAALKALKDFLGGVLVLRNPLNLLLIVCTSAAVWFTAVLCYYIFFMFFGLPATFEIAAGVTVLIALAVAVPSGPAFIGVFQAGAMAGFSLYHLDTNIGGAYSLISHLFTFLFIVGYGSLVVIRYGLSLKRLQEVAETEQEGGEVPLSPDDAAPLGDADAISRR